MRGVDVEALSRRYGPMVLRRCRRLLGDEDQALDACQDVFLRVLQHWAPSEMFSLDEVDARRLTFPV